MLAQSLVRSLSAFVVILAAAACDGDPMGEDPGLLRGSWATRPEHGYLAPTPTGPMEVRRVQILRFGDDGRYVQVIYLADARNDQWLGEVYRAEGTYTVIGTRIRMVLLAEAQHTGPYAWGDPLVVKPVEPSARSGSFVVTPDRLDLGFPCNDVVIASCVAPEPFFRVPEAIS